MSIYRGHTKNEIYLASLLYDAIEDCDLRSIRTLLIDKGANPNLVLPKKHIAPFHLIIGNDDEKFALDVVILILQYGGNPNVKADDGLTPLHIAAAWGRLETVNLLLLCGGDPEQCDNTKKTPIYYAFEENYAECFDLLRRYANDKFHIFNNYEKEDKFNLVLDKIIVNNGTTLGEYEIVNEYKTDNNNLQQQQQQRRNHLKKLDDLLPKTNTNEFVMNWFNNQLTNNLPTTTTTIKIQRQNSSEISGNTTEFSSELNNSSINESDDNIDDSFEKSRNLHKIYRKRMKKSPKRSPNTTNNTVNSITRNFSTESGIVPFEITKTGGGSSSSDYLTCSTGGGSCNSNNLHERNIFEITSDRDEEIKSILTKSEGIDSDVNSTIAISEIYKYTDKDEGIVLYERRLLKTPISDCNGSIKSSVSYKSSSLPETIDYEDYDTDTIRKELTLHGYNPGPITVTTKRVYLKKLKQIRKYPNQINDTNDTSKRVYSPELEKTLKNPEWLNDITKYKQLDDLICKQFSTNDYTRKWREGTNKSSFTYLLLDPRVTNNLPNRTDSLKPYEIWQCFLSSIFYVGKGKRSRPYSHLYEAITVWNQQQQQQQQVNKQNNKKLERILNIWNDNCGVICLHLFQNTIPVEAYTREAAIIAALKIDNLCNQKYGDFYGVASTWSKKEKTMFGVFLLYKAMMIFLNEGERQLAPNDID